MDGEQDRGLLLPDAARRLGITENALRKRVQRGTIAATKGVDERWYVFLPSFDQAADQATGQAAGQPTAGSPGQPDHATVALASALQDEVTWLRSQFAHKDQTIAALAARVADLADRLPALAPGPTDAPGANSAAPGGTERSGSGRGNPAPWWRACRD